MRHRVFSAHPASRASIWVVVLVALGLAGGIAYAAIPDSSGVVHACVKDGNGQLRVIDPSAGHCLPSESPISWNEAGPQGPPGVSGYEQNVEQVFLAPGAYGAVSARCSTGKKVLGGGFSIETPTDVKVFDSGPGDGAGNLADDRWTVTAQNTGSVGPRQVTAFAVCASVS